MQVTNLNLLLHRMREIDDLVCHERMVLALLEHGALQRWQLIAKAQAADRLRGGIR